jgi:hypothetical protein
MGRAFNVHVKVEGLDRTLLKLKNAQEVAGKAAAQGLYIEGEKVMGESKARYVPVKHGNLRSSGHVAPPKRTKNYVWRIDMGYGGPSVPYALVQHENLHYRHPHGSAKYLEKPALKAAPKMGKRVGRVVMAALRRLKTKGA